MCGGGVLPDCHRFGQGDVNVPIKPNAFGRYAIKETKLVSNSLPKFFSYSTVVFTEVFTHAKFSL